MEKMRNLKYELLGHPPYLPDLAFSDSHLFPNLKKFVTGKCFETNEEVTAAVNGCSEDLELHFTDGIQLSEKLWAKYTTLKRLL